MVNRVIVIIGTIAIEHERGGIAMLANQTQEINRRYIRKSVPDYNEIKLGVVHLI